MTQIFTNNVAVTRYYLDLMFSLSKIDGIEQIK